MKTLYLTLVFLCAATGAMSEQVQTSLGPVHVEKMAANLDSPWAIGILPGGAFLVTERGGTLIYVDQGRRRSVSGVPKVATTGQGGLLDVTIARDFAQSREVFLTFAKPQKGGAGTALAVARLSRNGGRLTDTRILFEARPGGTGGRHFGSRVVERADGTLFVTVGERGDRPAAQDLSNHLGTVVRIGRDGAVPPDNPFVGRDDARPEIWSYGHRNPQGAALGCTGAVMGVGTWRARRGRGQPRAARRQLRVAEDLVRDALFGRKDRRGDREAGDGTACTLLGPLNRTVRFAGLFGETLARMERRHLCRFAQV